MPVMTHIVNIDPQADGFSHVIVRMFTNDPKEITQTFFAPPDFDINAQVAQIIADVNIQLAESEFEQVTSE